MNYSIVILYTALLLAPTTGLSQEQQMQTGTVYGRVFNASKTHSSASDAGLNGQEVVLYKYVDGKEVEGARPHTVTDADGGFEFKELTVGKRYSYYPVSVLEGVEYYGDLVSLTTDSLQKRGDVPVFEPTTSDSSVAVSMQHIIITPGVSALSVKEVLVFTNRGRYTYVGQTPAGQPGKNIVLRLDVPDKAAEVQFGGDLMQCCAVVKENQIFDTMAFKPGMRQEVVSYRLPYQGQNATLIKTVAHPTTAVDVFLPEKSGTLSSSNLISRGSFPIRGKSYQRFSGSDFAAGDIVTLTLTDLPRTPRDWRWLPPVLLGTLVLAGLGIYRRGKHQDPPVETASMSVSSEKERDRQRLVEEILQLDEVFEAGGIDESTYVTAREKLKQQVLAIDEEPSESATEPRQSEEVLSHEKQ